jgi:hypothetical protein
MIALSAIAGSKLAGAGSSRSASDDASASLSVAARAGIDRDP